jgi:hypothetical protein
MVELLQEHIIKELKEYEYNGEIIQLEKIAEPEFDLPRSMSQIAAFDTLRGQRIGAIDKCGLMVRTGYSILKLIKPVIEIFFGRMTIEYRITRLWAKHPRIKCWHCEKYLEFDAISYNAEYYISGIWHGRKEMTEHYKVGGDLTEDHRLGRLNDDDDTKDLYESVEMGYHV